MKEVKIKYIGGKKQLIISFSFKGKMILEKNEIYTSKRCKLLEDKEIVKELIEKYNCVDLNTIEIPKKKVKKFKSTTKTKTKIIESVKKEIKDEDN